MIDLALDERVFINSRIDEAIQELDLLFNTANTELIGDKSYGTNFEQFLWVLIPTIEDIQFYIREKIQEHTYFLRQLEYDIDVNYLEGNMRTIYKITINIYDKNNGQSKQRIYQFK